LASVVALRADVYSSTAAEIFWSPGSGDVTSFNVHINGEYLDTTDGTSYFMSNLQADTSYTLEVYTVAADSSVSAATSVELRTRSAFGESGSSVSTGPQAPANLSLVVYSSTAAELFWDRAAVADGVVGADIYRNTLMKCMPRDQMAALQAPRPFLNSAECLLAICQQLQ